MAGGFIVPGRGREGAVTVEGDGDCMPIGALETDPRLVLDDLLSFTQVSRKTALHRWCTITSQPVNKEQKSRISYELFRDSVKGVK